jgi:outer membrane lipoprotein-sorting protein
MVEPATVEPATAGPARPVQSGPMTNPRSWDRAALAIVDAERRRPEVPALPADLPEIGELFDFMRDAELRFVTLRMRVVERAVTTRGEEATEFDVFLRHAGDAKVMTSRPGEVIGGHYEIWISDGDVVRTYVHAHRLGTERPVRNRPRGLGDPDIPGSSKVYEPVTALPMETIPDTFVHPAGYCQNVLATGSLWVDGTDTVIDRPAIVVRCDHPRTIEMVGDRPDFAIRIAVDRETGVILRLTETIGGQVTRDAEVTEFGPDAPLPPSAFQFAFPTGTTLIY